MTSQGTSLVSIYCTAGTKNNQLCFNGGEKKTREKREKKKEEIGQDKKYGKRKEKEMVQEMRLGKE